MPTDTEENTYRKQNSNRKYLLASRHAQHESQQAKQIQKAIGCSWEEALRLARLKSK